jgi:hypothetical protein
MFIASFNLKTSVQKLLFNLQDFRDFSRLHPAREMKRLALRESVRYARKHMRNSVGVESAREVLSLALRQVRVSGHCLEFGVYKGGTIRFIANQLGTSQPVHGFDSFDGLEEAWSGDPSRFDAQGRLPKVPVNVALHKGYFSDTLPGWAGSHLGPVAFLHIDCDLYQSTKCVFEQLSDRIVPGTVIVFDEYFNYPNWQAHEFRAFQEFVERYQVRYEYLAYARFQVAVKIQEIGGPRDTSVEESALEALQSGVSGPVADYFDRQRR